MNIKKGNNCFYIGEYEDSPDAILIYTINNNTLTIDHTIVNPAMQGQGIAKYLLNRVVEYARENNYKIIPICSYAVKKMINNPEYIDVLA